MTDKQVTSVFETSDYDKFKFMLGNRNINLSSVKKIEESISQNGFKMCPILVNEKFEIVDGQHRFNALKDLGLPIYYVIENGLNIEDCKNLNINAKNWTLDDYVESYASLGYEEYIKLLNLKTELKISTSVAITLFDKAGINHNPLYVGKNGKLKISFSLEKIKDVLKCHKLLSTNYACYKWYEGVRYTESYGALRFFLHINCFNKDFDLDFFLNKLATKSNNLRQGFTYKDLISSFGDFYNASKRSTNKLDFDHIYAQYRKLVQAGKFLENIE